MLQKQCKEFLPSFALGSPSASIFLQLLSPHLCGPWVFWDWLADVMPCRCPLRPGTPPHTTIGRSPTSGCWNWPGLQTSFIIYVTDVLEDQKKFIRTLKILVNVADFFLWSYGSPRCNLSWSACHLAAFGMVVTGVSGPFPSSGRIGVASSRSALFSQEEWGRAASHAEHLPVSHDRDLVFICCDTSRAWHRTSCICGRHVSSSN